MMQLEQLLQAYLRNCPPAIKGSAAIRAFTENLLNQVKGAKTKDQLVMQISDKIDKIISSTKGDKVPLVQFVAGFCSFTEREVKLVIEPRVLSAEVIDDTTERRLRVACFLHEPKSREEIIARFFQSERTIRDDLKALREGFTFMGHWIQIEEVREKGKIWYVSTMHPVFLPLNLTEVYALTAGLLAALPAESPMYEMYQYLAESIYSQLSDYGKSVIARSAEKSGVSMPLDVASRRGYCDERILIRRREGALMYMFKRGEDCVVTYVEDGENKEVQGRIKPSGSGVNKITVVSDDASYELEYANVIKIEPLQYR